MGVEIRKEIISQLQISLRNRANVHSYDPNDPSLPNDLSSSSSSSFLPHSLSDSPHRCLHCRAHLLRGPDSLLCIFCGKHQFNRDAPPHPINFKSTSGYRWFLNSLNLDGSEIVGDSLGGGGNEWNKEPKVEIPLSDVLDLEIRWNDAEQERFESSLGKNNRLNLAGFGVDDDFLSERKGDSVSTPSQGSSVVKKEVDSDGSNAFQSRQNLSLFENVQGSKSSGSVSGWQAEFQPADSKTDIDANSSRSFDAFGSSSKDLASHMDTVFGQGTNLFDGKEKDNQASSESKTGDLFQDDMQSNSTSGVRIEDVGISSSADVGLIQGDQGQSSGNIAPDKGTNDDDDDSFGAWNDFKGSTGGAEAAKSSSDQTADGMKSVNEKGGDSSSGLGAGSGSTVFETPHEVSKSFDHFADFSADLSTHMDSVFGTGRAVANTTSSHTTNWFQDDLWSNSTSATVHQAEKSGLNVGDKDGGMLGILNNSSESVNRIQDNQWPTSSDRAADSGTNDEDDDSFGAWNDFTTSIAPNSSISSWKEPTNHTSSTEEKSSDPFSGWAPDFQSPNSKNLEGSKSSDPFAVSSVDLSDHLDTAFASGKDLVDEKAKDDSNASNANNWFQDDLWSNSTLKETRQAENLDATVDVVDSGTAQSVHISPSMDVDWFPNDQWLTGNNKAPDRKTVDESDNSFGDWDDFQSSTTVQDAFSSSWKQAARPDVKTIDDNDDLSAAWNDFTSSTSTKDPSSSSVKQTVNHEKPSIETSETYLFSMDSNSHSNNFGSSSQFDFFSGTFSNENGSIEAPLSNRVADASIKGGSNAEVAKDGGISSATTGSKTDDIEILLSQMHDLSFMLESNLSIPSKVQVSKD